MTWCNSQPVGDVEGWQMYTCLANILSLGMYEDEYEDENYFGKKHLIMYKQIYFVNRWLYIHYQCGDDEDFSLYFFTLTDVCDLSRHYFASLLIKHTPKVEGDMVYMSMTGYRYIRLQACMHQLEQGEGFVNEAYATLNNIIKNVILQPHEGSRLEALNTVNEIQDKYSVMMSVENILVIREKYRLLLDNLEYIMKNCTCKALFEKPHENCAILKYFR